MVAARGGLEPVRGGCGKVARVLTVNAGEMVPGQPRLLQVIEAGPEDGHATAALAQAAVGRDGCGALFVESGATGGCYGERRVIGGEVEAWFGQQGFIALFEGEEAMRAGGRRLAAVLGSRLPAGVRRVITGPGDELEAGLQPQEARPAEDMR